MPGGQRGHAQRGQKNPEILQEIAEGQARAPRRRPRNVVPVEDGTPRPEGEVRRRRPPPEPEPTAEETQGEQGYEDFEVEELAPEFD